MGACFYIVRVQLPDIGPFNPWVTHPGVFLLHNSPSPTHVHRPSERTVYFQDVL